MPNLKNITDDALYLGINGRRIEKGQIVSVDGDISDESPADAYLIGDRLWPKATWKSTGGKTPDEPDVTNEEN